MLEILGTTTTTIDDRRGLLFRRAGRIVAAHPGAFLLLPNQVPRSKISFSSGLF